MRRLNAEDLIRLEFGLDLVSDFTKSKTDLTDEECEKELQAVKTLKDILVEERLKN